MEKIIFILAALAGFLLAGNILHFFKAITKFLPYLSETSAKSRAVVIENIFHI